MGRGNSGREAAKIALPALLTAIGLVLLYISCILPSGRWAVVAIAGLCPAVAIVSTGVVGGSLTYAATAILGFLLAPDKGIILLYVLFFGLYPIIKFLIEKLKKLPVEILCKLVFFNIILTLFLMAFSAFFLPAMPEMIRGNRVLIYIVINVVFLIYDFGFTKLMWFYTQRIAKAVRH
ncbi:MAG: hypothetical protein RR807_03030 [Oscillospiraceae bacterium]